jgi:hypothetical protein
LKDDTKEKEIRNDKRDTEKGMEVTMHTLNTNAEEFFKGGDTRWQDMLHTTSS